MDTWKTVHVVVDDAAIAGDDPMVVIEPVWQLATFYDGPAAYEESLRRFSTPQRFIWATLWYASEVFNGGHDQFYSNSTGMVWADALAGFEAMQISEAVDIVRESARRLGGAPSLERDARNQQLDLMEPDFSDLDDRFYALDQEINLNARRMSFIRSQPRAFYFSGLIQPLFRP